MDTIHFSYRRSANCCKSIQVLQRLWQLKLYKTHNAYCSLIPNLLVYIKIKQEQRIYSSIDFDSDTKCSQIQVFYGAWTPYICPQDKCQLTQIYMGSTVTIFNQCMSFHGPISSPMISRNSAPFVKFYELFLYKVFKFSNIRQISQSQKQSSHLILL